jgi:hypothetical protein
MKFFTSFTDSVEKIARFVLPGAYIVLLSLGVKSDLELNSEWLKWLIAFVVVFLGPTVYFFYREVAGIADDIILKCCAKMQGIYNLSEYKAKLYEHIQTRETELKSKKAFQSYMYMKFSSVHHGILLSSLTVAATVYATCCRPRTCFLSNHSCEILMVMAVVFLASAYNWRSLHLVQHEHFRRRKQASPQETA